MIKQVKGKFTWNEEAETLVGSIPWGNTDSKRNLQQFRNIS
jgi:hypothetical protein